MIVFPLSIYIVSIIDRYGSLSDWTSLVLLGALLIYIAGFFKGLQVYRNIRWDLTLTPKGIHYPPIKDQIDTDFIPWQEISCFSLFQDTIGIDLKQGRSEQR